MNRVPHKCLNRSQTFSTTSSSQQKIDVQSSPSIINHDCTNTSAVSYAARVGFLLANGMEDHVHLLAKLRPDRALSDVLRELKSNATGWMHDVFPRLSDFSWQRGYAAFTVSQSNLKYVQRYLARQKEHHQQVSFRDEFIKFLKVNRIEYDERYI